MSGANPLPPLAADVESQLRESIRRHGVRTPILIDQHGEIFDGRNRHRIATELDMTCPSASMDAPDDPDERAELLIALNDARRPRTSPEERRVAVERLRQAGMSQRTIAEQIGVSKRTIQKDLAQVDTGIHLDGIADGNGDSDRKLRAQPQGAGRDGKTYPRRRKPRSKIVRPVASPAWARQITGQLRKLSAGVLEAQQWCDSGKRPPPEMFTRLSDARDAATRLARDLNRLLEHDTAGTVREPETEPVVPPRASGPYNPFGNFACAPPTAAPTAAPAWASCVATTPATSSVGAATSGDRTLTSRPVARSSASTRSTAPSTVSGGAHERRIINLRSRTRPASTASVAADSPPCVVDKGSYPTVVPPEPVPGPDPGSIEEAELDVYLRQHAAGTLSPLVTPLAVELPDLPAGASAALRAVYEDFRLVRGIRLAACDDRPVPYGAAWVAARLDLGKLTVVRARQALVDAKVLTYEGELPARGKGNGTRTYLPGKRGAS
jgi:ParB-like chromosome segregation protein Spo0J